MLRHPLWPQDGPKKAPGGLKRARRGSKRTPRCPQAGPGAPTGIQGEPKTGPKMAPKTAQSRLQVAAFRYLTFKTPQDVPKIPPRPPPDPSKGPAGRVRRPQETPKRGPERPQEGPKRGPEPPRGSRNLPGFSSVLGFSPERSWVLALRSRASVLIFQIVGSQSVYWVLALRSYASALIVQRSTNVEGFTWAPTLSFRLISEIVGFSSGVFSSELLGLSFGIPF